MPLIISQQEDDSFYLSILSLSMYSGSTPVTNDTFLVLSTQQHPMDVSIDQCLSKQIWNPTNNAIHMVPTLSSKVMLNQDHSYLLLTKWIYIICNVIES